jgi:toxin ParE1/3/4
VKRVRVSRDAQGDLDEIWMFIARDDIAAANRVIDNLTSRLPLLAASPRMGRDRKELGAGLRGHVVGNYLIDYRETPPGIFVLRILHGARDVNRLLQP